MLRGLNPILGPDLLHCLRSMGHVDEIAIVDGNYPADGNANRLLREVFYNRVKDCYAVIATPEGALYANIIR